MYIDTDYLIVGAGASGLAFADSLLAETDVDVVLVDRRNHPGGHWQDAYPFIRLHAASAYYGVNSLSLGKDQLTETGRNAGFYEQAGAAEICAYFETVCERLTSTGRVKFLAEHDHLGGDGDEHQVRDLRSGDLDTVRVRRSVVDARYLEGTIPATHQPAFTRAPEANFIPVNDLPDVADSYQHFTIIGAGKTSADACLWLLDQAVSPEQIRWIRPRDAWFIDRASLQPLDQVAALMEGISYDAEAAAQATDLIDCFERLEDRGRVMRLDPSVSPTMFRATMLSRHELNDLREILDVVRLGRVRAIESDRIVFDDGELPTSADVLHVDCSARGLSGAVPVPVFGHGQIVLQQVRQSSPTFNAALIAFVEAHREHHDEKNQLCPPTPVPSHIKEWGPLMSRTWAAEQIWLKEPDIVSWIAASRLNILRALPEHAHEPRAQQAFARFLTNVGPAIERHSPAAGARPPGW
ncbi:NAD(P)-binding protein [Aeromicrobium sp.]|uniref:NAD(P)-binding protein n=1 Tax=Aeromicrobium sp. TaxID=1871063 RepID=UPI003C51874F